MREHVEVLHKSENYKKDAVLLLLFGLPLYCEACYAICGLFTVLDILVVKEKALEKGGTEVYFWFLPHMH